MADGRLIEDDAQPGRFLTLDQVSRELNITSSQTYSLVRKQQLRAVKIGDKGQYRVARVDLEAYLERAYAETTEFLNGSPYTGRGATEADK